MKNIKDSRDLLKEDFNNGKKPVEDKRLNNWTIVDEGTIKAPSKWSIVRGEFVQSSNIFGPDVTSCKQS